MSISLTLENVNILILHGKGDLRSLMEENSLLIRDLKIREIILNFLDVIMVLTKVLNCRKQAMSECYDMRKVEPVLNGFQDQRMGP